MDLTGLLTHISDEEVEKSNREDSRKDGTCVNESGDDTCETCPFASTEQSAGNAGIADANDCPAAWFFAKGARKVAEARFDRMPSTGLRSGA
jgi:hypothetical protein